MDSKGNFFELILIARLFNEWSTWRCFIVKKEASDAEFTAGEKLTTNAHGKHLDF